MGGYRNTMGQREITSQQTTRAPTTFPMHRLTGIATQ